MIEIATIDHVVLRTKKIEDMLRFCCDVLGCTVERETSAEMGLVQLRAGNALVDLVNVESNLGRLGGGPPTATENNLDHFCLQLKVISEEDIREHLQKHGIKAGDFQVRPPAATYGIWPV